MSSLKSKSSLKDYVYQSILEDILSKKYLPGDILTEKALLEKYECSKSPIREALITLCNEQVLRSFPRYGYEVVRLSSDDVKDILQFRFALESGIISDNLSLFTEKSLKSLEEIDAECTKAKEQNDFWLHWDYNAKFHLHLLACCDNTYAVNELKRCMDCLKRAYIQVYLNSQHETEVFQDPLDHSPIIESIRNRDREKLFVSLKNDLTGFFN